MLDSFDKIENVARLYIECSGMLEYGLSFLNMNKNRLGDSYYEFHERLRAFSNFLDRFYMMYHDIITEHEVDAAKEVSDSNMEVASRMESLTDFIMIITMVGICISVSSVLMSSLDDPNPILALGLMAGLSGTPVVFMVYQRFVKGHLTYAIYLSTVCIMFTAATLAMTGSASCISFYIVDQLHWHGEVPYMVQLASSIVLTVVCTFILRKTILDNESILNILEKTGLDISESEE